MKGKQFLDTNILVYSFEKTDKGKIARSIIDTALQTHQGMISYQVIQELLNVAFKKFKVPLEPKDADTLLKNMLFPLCEVYPSIELYQMGIAIHSQFSIHFYDALIIAAATLGGCRYLLSEDLQHNQKFGILQVINPFV